MITGLFIGFFIALVLIFILGTVAQKFAIKKGWFASAMWSEKEKAWKVRGKYLSVAAKIHAGIQEEYRTGNKTVKYMD